MYRCKSLVAQVQLHTEGHAPTTAVPKRLRHCAALHVSQKHATVVSTVTSLCSFLQEGSYYIPSPTDGLIKATTSTTVEAHTPLQAFVLWPALQPPPNWLTEDYHAVRGAEVRVRWSFTFKQRAYLNTTNMSKTYQEQPMLVWQLRNPLRTGQQLQLPPVRPPQASTTAFLSKPWFNYIVCFKRQAARDPAEEFDATCSILHGTVNPTDKASLNPLSSINPAGCSLQQLYMEMEEGMFHPFLLEPEDADALLERVMIEGDDELLQMLMEEGLGDRCTVPALQMLLQYAQLEELPQLAQQVLQNTDVELTSKVLEWLIRELLVSSSPFELGQLLKDYCIMRRNPLSSVAAVEEELAKIGQSSATQSQAAALLSSTFRAVKRALLQQLLQPGSEQVPSEPGLQIQSSGSYTSLSSGQSGKVDTALQEQLQMCLAEKGGQSIGTGGLGSSLSIHDISPYAAALRLRDSDFLSLPPIMQYTYRLWNGTELEAITSQLLDAAGLNSVRLGSKAFSRKSMKNAHTMQRKASKAAPVAGTDMLSLGVRQAAGLSQKPSETAADREPHSRLLLHGPDSISAVVATTSCGSCHSEAAANLCAPLAVKSDDATAIPAVDSSIAPYRSAGTAAAATWVDSLPAGSAGQANWSEPAISRPHLSGMPGPIAEAVGFPSHGSAATAQDCISSASRTAGSVICSQQDCEAAIPTPAPTELQDLEAAIRNSRYLTPLVGLEILQSMGLAGSGSQVLLHIASRAGHMALLAPRALYCCPKGRWIVRCLFELLFLLEYQVTTMISLSSSGDSLAHIEGIFPILVVGNLVDIAFQLHYKHKHRLQGFISDNWAVLDVVVNVGQFAVMLWALVRRLTSHAAVDDAFVHGAMDDALVHNGDHLDAAGLDPLWVLSSAFAVLVWARALGIIIPLSAKLGAMLYTLRRAAAEGVVMVPLILVLMLGFGTTLTACYGHAPHSEYGTLAGALRMLVGATGGGLDLLWFEEHSGDDPFLQVWGQAIMVCYVIVVNILIMTLLIAVINYSYHPAQVKAETVVMHAESVHHYHWHRRYGITCSPGNILQLLLLWLPTGYRSRVAPAACLKYWVPPLDGYVPESQTSMQVLLLPTGPAEVGYLLFLLTLYPLMSVTAVFALLLHVPFGVVHFACQGYQRWWDVDVSAEHIRGAGISSVMTSAAVSTNGRSADVARSVAAAEQQVGVVAALNGMPATASKLPRQSTVTFDDGVVSKSASAAHKAVVAKARRNSGMVPVRQGSTIKRVDGGDARPTSGGASPLHQGG